MSLGFGKANRTSLIHQVMNKQSREIAILYGQQRAHNTPKQIEFPVLGGSPASALNGYDRIARNGDAMIGPLGFLRRLGGLDVVGNLDVSVTGYFSNYVALTNLGGSSDFRSISGVINDGQLLILFNNTGLPITVKEASIGNDNIETITHQDVILNNEDFMLFIWDAHPGSLKQITTGSSSNSAYFTTGSPNISLSGMEWPVIRKGSGSYTVDAQNGPGSDYFIVMIDPSFARNVTLPDAAVYKGRVIVIKHGGTLFNVNVLPQPSQAIDGASSYVINTIYGSITVFSDGFNWFIISKYT